MHSINKKQNSSYGILYVVATPIGNINDITHRAIEILTKVQLIAIEDTRHSKKILDFYGIKTKRTSYHKFNELKKSDFLINFLKEGNNVAIISDAGTPCISDPGDILIQKAHENSITVSPIPGPSSLISAISVSGSASDNFTFIGFLPKKTLQKLEVFNKFYNSESSLVFFESPKRVLGTLSELKKIYSGEKKIFIAKEITKVYENISILTIDSWINYFNHNNSEKLKGEFVFLIPKNKKIEKIIKHKEVESFLKILLENDVPYNSSIKIACRYFCINKNDIYKKFIGLAKK